MEDQRKFTEDVKESERPKRKPRKLTERDLFEKKVSKPVYMANSWVTFLKDFAQRNNMKYSDAIKSQKAKEEYRKKHGKGKKKQGFNAQLDESLGERHKGKKKQNLKARRDESKGEEGATGRRAYAAVMGMDKGRRSKK